jgi:TDG/mug DNA glycosylase family protein
MTRHSSKDSRRGDRATAGWERLRLEDRIEPGVRILFVGINPGVRSALTGHHFAGFSNRFWRLLHESGLVPEPIAFRDDVRLPEWGLGITNLIARPTPGIDTLKPKEFVASRAALLQKIERYRPPTVALVGVTLFRALFPEQRRAAVRLGPQSERLAGSAVFVLPNTSGRNANFSYDEMLRAFTALARAPPAPNGATKPARTARSRTFIDLSSPGSPPAETRMSPRGRRRQSRATARGPRDRRKAQT